MKNKIRFSNKDGDTIIRNISSMKDLNKAFNECSPKCLIQCKVGNDMPDSWHLAIVKRNEIFYKI